MNRPFDALSKEWCEAGGPMAPPIRATLMFCYELDAAQRIRQVLLIRKKRGLGAGKINAPGGKVDLGETFLDAAIRETNEEVGIQVQEAKEMGRLWFFFVDGLSLEVAVFVSCHWEGEAMETAEAIPIWTPPDEIDFEEMWEDDRFWLPAMLKGETFAGMFAFDQEKLLDSRVAFGSAINFIKIKDFYLHFKNWLLRVA